MMTAEQLKGSILQLAMRGKLVEQRPEEGTGEELYKAIQIEKSGQINSGAIKKEKNIDPPLDDEIPFDIPSSWKWVRFGSITYNRDSERIPLSVSERTKLKKIYDYYGASGVIDKVENYLFDKPLLLIGEDGANLLNRSTPIAFIAKGKYWVNNHAHVIDMSPLLLMTYISYYINSISLAKYVTGTAQPKMNQAKMNSIWVPLPPLAEQRRIVAKIEELMPFVEQYGAVSTKLSTLNATFPEMMKKSILQEAVQGKLVPQDPNDEPASVLLKKIAEEKKRLIKEGKIKKQKPLPKITEDEIPFEIPESWEWVKLGNIIDLLSGTDFKPSEYSDISGKTVYITGASCLTDQGVISQRWTDTPRNIASKGDLLIVCKGSGYGKTVICDVDEAHIARQIMAIKDWGLLDLNYVRFFLQSRMTYIKQSGQGVIPGIDRGTILNMAFPLPPLSEQKRIVSFTSKALETVETLGNGLK